MASHRLHLPIPADADLRGDKDLRDGESFARHIAAAVLPGVEPTVHAIEKGGAVLWAAHDWQADGSFVVLHVDPTDRCIDLYIDTRGIERPPPPLGWWVWPLIILIVAVALAVGIWRQSILLGAGIAATGLGSWVAIDIARQIATERRRTIDAASWEAHLHACILRASQS